MLSVRFSLFLLLALALVALVSSDDLKKCEDGSYVSRDPKTGEFFPCKPNTNPTPTPTPSDSSDDNNNNNNNDFPPSPTCKKDLYMCPDGTFVGRSGKDCAFPACQCLSNIKTCEDGSSVGTDPTTCEFLPCPNNNNNNNEPVVCPTDLFLCADGSFVSRDPTTCAFLPCNPPKNPNQPSSNSGDDSDSDSDDDNSSNDGVSISEAVQSFSQTVDFAQYIISIQSSTMEGVAPIYPWMKMKQYSHHGYHSENHHHSRYANKQVILVYMNINTPPLKDLPHRYYSFPVFYAVQTISLDYETYSCPFRPVLCPDGSYWSLTGKDCNYASCPVVIEVTMDNFNPIPTDSESEEDSSIIGVVLATLVFPLGIILLGMCVCYCRRRSSRACSRKASNWKGYSEDKASLLPQTTPTPLSVPPTPFPTKKSPTQQKVSQQQQQPQPSQQQQQTFTIVNSPQIQDFMVPSPAYGMLPSFPALNPYFLPVDQNGNFNYQIPMAFQPPMYPMMYNPQEQQQQQEQGQQ